MARETIVTLVDDIDGSVAASTVTFGLDGYSYEIDLSDKNNNALRTALNPFIEGARRVRGGSARGRASGRTTDKDRNATIRTWALDNGVELPSRGRIAGAVQDAYDAKDVPRLYAAVGLEMEPEAKPRRGRGRSAEFSSAE
jgi:hypothetical protein